ncbi:MAG: KEOPS complex subunit Pcc1 [Candidatus Hadarchaeales archaeon]
MSARIELTYRNRRTAASIARALQPDNSRLPEGVTVSTVHSGRTVFNEVKIEGKIGTMLSTLDDILACTASAENVILG